MLIVSLLFKKGGRERLCDLKHADWSSIYYWKPARSSHV